MEFFKNLKCFGVIKYGGTNSIFISLKLPSVNWEYMYGQF